MNPTLRQDTRATDGEDPRRAGSADRSTPPVQGGDGGANPTPALHISPKDLVVAPIPHAVAAHVVTERHYLHSPPSAVRLSLGVFAAGELLGVAMFNAGPRGGPSLFRGAKSPDVLSLCRLWLDDRLPRNSESRVLAVACRALARHTAAKAVIAYADPGAGHEGHIYRAVGWLFLGESDAQPLMSLNGAPPKHLRTVGALLHTHSAEFLRRSGFDVRLVPTTPKFLYVKILDPAWADRLLRSPRPYRSGGESA